MRLMKIIPCLMMTSTLLIISSCKKEEQQMIVSYANLYDRFLKEKVEESPSGYTKFSLGYTDNKTQGHQNWYFGIYEGNQFTEIPYDEKDASFKNKNVLIRGSIIMGQSACLKWSSTYTGKVFIDGKLKTFADSSLKIMIDDREIASYTLEKNRSAYIDIDSLITSAEKIYFVITGEVEFNPAIHFGQKNEDNLHYDSGKDTDYPYVGDVHPLYVDGQLRNYYLSTSGFWTSDMAISDDLVIFRDTDTKASKTNPPASEGFATRVFQHNGEFFSFHGALDRLEFTRSDDGYEFHNGVALNQNNEVEGQIRIDNKYVWARDPYAFYDEDIQRYRVVAMHYIQNRTDTSLPIIDLALYTSRSDNPFLYEESSRPLVNFGLTNYEPEVPMFIKIGKRWYLFACMSGRTQNGVGPLSYWIGDENTKIDDVDWNAKEECILTGEDLCASQIAEIKGRYFLYGWIPQDAFNSRWGGTINIPQEVYQKDNGKLGVRLDDYLKEKLSKGIIDDLRKSSYSITGQVDNSASILKISGLANGQAKIQFENHYDRSLIVAKAGNLAENNLFGVELTEGADVYQIRYSRKSNTISVHKKGGRSYSTYEIEDPKLSGIEMVIIAEGNILEVFINGEYATCARLDGYLRDYQVGIYTNQKGLDLEEFVVNKLATRFNFQDN